MRLGAVAAGRVDDTATGVLPGQRGAEAEGFEPPDPRGSPAFKAGAFGHSATLPVDQRSRAATRSKMLARVARSWTERRSTKCSRTPRRWVGAAVRRIS